MADVPRSVGPRRVRPRANRHLLSLFHRKRSHRRRHVNGDLALVSAFQFNLRSIAFHVDFRSERP